MAFLSLRVGSVGANTHTHIYCTKVSQKSLHCVQSMFVCFFVFFTGYSVFALIKFNNQKHHTCSLSLCLFQILLKNGAVSHLGLVHTAKHTA